MTAEESVATGNCTLTRAEVAARLGISTSSVRRLESKHLHPVMDERGVWRFDPVELDGLAANERGALLARVPRRALSDAERERARTGRLAARVFGMFARGMELPQIVVATRQPPAVVRELYREWSTGLEEAWRGGRW